MKKVGNWIWGLVLIALGVIWALKATGVVDFELFFPGWWTLFIIVPCFIGLLTDEHKWGNFIGILIGVCLMLGCLGVLSFDLVWKLLFPAILVLIGLSILFRGVFRNETSKKIKEVRAKNEGKQKDGDNDAEEYWATFGGQDVVYDGKEFKGCRVDAVFGGVDLDLRGANVKDESIVRASSFFGGVTIYVPDDIKVEVASTSIFGGVSDTRKKENRKKKSKDDEKKTKANNDGKTLYIDASCVFGGVEIR